MYKQRLTYVGPQSQHMVLARYAAALVAAALISDWRKLVAASQSRRRSDRLSQGGE
jgi:hypothetical protein